MNVFVIIVNFNGWKDTIECIESLNSLRLPYLSIIVVDNNSNDDESRQILKSESSEKRFELILSKYNGGFSYGNNLGIRLALAKNADFVLLINNDTIVEEDFITPLIEFLKKNINCGAISPRINFFYDKKKIWYDGGDFNKFICKAKHFRFEKVEAKSRGYCKTNYLTGCCILLPKKVIDDVGLLDERFFLYGEDTEYCLRIKKMGYSLFWDSDCVIYHKVSASTGRYTKQTLYYQVRNNLIIGEMYQNLIQRLITKCYDKIFYLYKVLFKGYDYKTIQRAMQDHKKGIVGKVDI